VDTEDARLERVRKVIDDWEASYGIDPLPEHWGITQHIKALREALDD